MNRLYHYTGCVLACGAVGMLALSGCSGRPSRIKPPSIDPAAASSKALAQFDADGDGALSTEELEKCPGLLWAIEWYDTDGDQSVSGEEIANRIRKWQEQKLGIRSLIAEVRLDGQPLADATVRFIPESYLGGAVKPASGTTDKRGMASISMAAEDMPAGLKGIGGVQGGVYRIEVTHSSRSIPAAFNTATTLGREIALDTVLASVQLELQSSQ